MSQHLTIRIIIYNKLPSVVEISPGPVILGKDSLYLFTFFVFALKSKLYPPRMLFHHPVKPPIQNASPRN